MLYTVTILALVMVVCRYCYIKGVRKTFEIYMTIAEEELLDKDFDWWTDGLIKYRKDGLRLRFFAITNKHEMVNYLSVRDVAEAMLYSVYNQGQREGWRTAAPTKDSHRT